MRHVVEKFVLCVTPEVAVADFLGAQVRAQRQNVVEAVIHDAHLAVGVDAVAAALADGGPLQDEHLRALFVRR